MNPKALTEKDGYSYLTNKEAEMLDSEVYLQIALGLKSCKKLRDVCDLLHDIRLHERNKWVSALALLKKRIVEARFDEASYINYIIDECFKIKEGQR